MPQKSAAILTIRDAAQMSRRGRKAIANWLRRHARFLESHGSDFSRRFTGRYLYR
jgi:hypothetical protein